MRSKSIPVVVMIFFCIFETSVFAGEIVAWGDNRYGQCNVPDGKDFIAISAGYDHAVALLADGSLVAWGGKAYGQCNVPNGNDFIKVATGQWHSLAMKSDGSLVAWGWNDYGQCNVPSGGGFSDIAAGHQYSSSIQSDGSLIAWGRNWRDQCIVPSGNDFLHVKSGLHFGLALKFNGSLDAWGSNSAGQCNVPSENGFIDIAAGRYHGLALRPDGSVIGWGWNYYGQCDVPEGNYVEIDAYFHHSLALKDDGSLVAFGWNDYGQCDVPEGNDFVAVSAGYKFGLALAAEPPTLIGLEITGPNEVAEDFSAQYKAIAHYDNGGTRDVTVSAEWSVDDEIIASIEAGLLTTEMVDLPQDITITAEYSEGENIQEAEKEVSIFTICPTGSALDFDGLDDYVEVADNDDSLDITDSLTISAWVNLNNIEPDNFIANKQPSGTWRKNYPGNYEFRISGGSLRLGHQTGTGGLEYSFYFSTSGIETGTWYHVAVTLVEGGDVNFYINGCPAGTSPQSGTFGVLNDEPVRIGTRKDTWSYLDGLTDDIRIYNRALSAEEILAGMHTKLTGDEDGLVAYWAFDEGAGQIAVDSSLYGNDGMLGLGPDEDESDPNWTYSIPPVGICSVEGIVERNLLNVLGMKNDVLDILNEAIGKEEALWEYMDIMFKDRNFGNTSKGDVAKAKQKIHSAIQEEEQASTAVDKSIEKLDDALDALDIE